MNTNEFIKKRYLNEHEVSQLTGIAVSTLRNDRHLRRGFPYLKIGKRSVRYITSDVVREMEKIRITFD
jgi:predicted DNA-binding transcriptional regulator AlpA